MTREATHKERMTPFALWIREKCREARTGLSVTNLDFHIEVFTDRSKKNYILVEEKMHCGLLSYGQAVQFQHLDICERLHAAKYGNDYWGFYLVQFSNTGPDDSDRILINGQPVTADQLREHINGDKKAAEGLHGGRKQEWQRFIAKR